MPRIRCHYLDCVFLDDGYCSSATIELDPDAGCLTYSQASSIIAENEWDEEEELDDEWDDLGFEEEEEDDWLEEDDDEF